MKWYNFLSFLVAAGMFSACNDDLGNSGNENGDTSSSGSGYVKIAINLPTTSGSSSRANDNFDGGLPAEYKVNDLILALFYGTDETSATCKWAKNLTNSLDFSTPGTATDNVTTRSDYMISDVPKPNTDQNVYAFAIVNNSGYFGVSGSDLTYGAAGTPAKFTGKLTDLFTNASATDLSKIASTDNGGNFMMTNAPISDKVTVTSGTAGWNPQITTLVKLDVYDDEPSAESATPNPIYVERVAAKVNVKINSSNNILTVGDDGTDPGATVEFGGWVLQNTNKKNYLVRNVVGTGTPAAWNEWIGYFNTGATDGGYNRFVGKAVGPYRTYWGIDPNYNTVLADEALVENFNIWTNVSASIPWINPANNGTQLGSEPVAYCAENTTAAKVMQHDQLTGVLLKATFIPSGSQKGDNFFICNDVSSIYKEAQIIQAFTVALHNAGLGLASGETLKLKDGAKAATIKDVAGLQAVFEITGGSTGLSEDRAKAILAEYNPIKFYEGGVTYYYSSLIKHFGDEYTPKGKEIVSLDDYTDNDHLGRWGVVRNNWYELVINSVDGPGEPEIPDLPKDPADKEHRYINCTINILSWAKRSQGVDL